MPIALYNSSPIQFFNVSISFYTRIDSIYIALVEIWLKMPLLSNVLVYRRLVG
jgi:hypothetical protein